MSINTLRVNYRSYSFESLAGLIVLSVSLSGSQVLTIGTFEGCKPGNDQTLTVHRQKFPKISYSFAKKNFLTQAHEVNIESPCCHQ